MTGNEATENNSSTSLAAFLTNHPDIEIFEAILPDINGKLRGKWVPRNSIEKAFDGGLKLPMSTLAFDTWGRDPAAWVFDSGDVDGICRPDLKSLATVPWLKRPTGQVILSLDTIRGEPCRYDPRNMLQAIIARFGSQLGFTPVLASELEFYLFKKERDANGRPLHTQTGIGGQTYGIDAMQDVSDMMHAIHDACVAQRLPIDTFISESAPSQFEINLFHQADALLAADHGLSLQRAIKGVAAQYDKRASFMAKPFADLAGNGMHVHCSIVDKDGRNAFDDGTDKGSALLRHAIAGCLATLGECFLLFAPNLNSYRRFQRANHAPMSPHWGYENRTVAIRVPAGSCKAQRIEHRVAGADANPYLVNAAILAGMLYGIENKLEAGPPVVGDAYKQFEPSFPASWPAAVLSFAQSAFVRDYLGEEFQQLYTGTKQQEIDEFDRQITPLEYEAYL